MLVRPVNLLFLLHLTLLLALSQPVRADRLAGAARRLASAQPAQSNFKSSCGNSEQVAHRIGQCMVPIFELIEGKAPAAITDADTIANCERFVNAEKCVRQSSRDCLSGLQKTAINTIPGAIKRFRSSECKSTEARAKYKEVTKCALKRAKYVQAVYKNHTAIVQAVRDLPAITPEQKVMKICCLLNSLDREIVNQFELECPKETSLVLYMLHAITDDARNTLCLNPKCENALQKVIPARLKQPNQNFIEPVAQILFMLNTDDDSI